MNTVRHLTVTLVGVVATCVLSAGAASAHVVPAQPVVLPTAAPIAVAHPQPNAGARTRQGLQQQSFIEHMQRVFGDRTAAAAGSPDGEQRAAVAPGGVHQGSTSRQAPSSSQSHTGSGAGIPVLAVTALAGLALGAAGSAGSRRLRHRSGLAA